MDTLNEVFAELISGVPPEIATKESVASQLPGRENGLADAYRHIVWSAEMARVSGANIANVVLNLKENPIAPASTASAMDYHNNDIGIAIGNYVRQNNGS